MKILEGERLIVALDLPTDVEVRRMFERLFPLVRFFKLGLEAFTAAGPDIVRDIKESGGRVFLDLKFHDIPRTVYRACRAALEHGVDIIDVHASGGYSMMREAARALEDWRGVVGPGPEGDTFPVVIGVTLLTHIGALEYGRIFGSNSGAPAVFAERLAGLAREAGLQGVVCSGREAGGIRAMAGENFLIVTPGVRPAGSDVGGHARAVTPLEALSNGADLVVVGRPITGAGDPAGAARSILEDISGA
jgi:orotidine-5'-phosphate decarboxylase